jgi:hypothetical protein
MNNREYIETKSPMQIVIDAIINIRERLGYRVYDELSFSRSDVVDELQLQFGLKYETAIVIVDAGILEGLTLDPPVLRVNYVA